jgi:hypothetical protein
MSIAPLDTSTLRDGDYIRWQCPECDNSMVRRWTAVQANISAWVAPGCPHHGYPWVHMVPVSVVLELGTDTPSDPI